MSNKKCVFVCGSCDDIFPDKFEGDVVIFKHDGKEMSETYCLLCSLSNSLHNIYDEFEDKEITLDSNKTVVFNLEQKNILNDCISSFNGKYDVKFTLDFFGFGLHTFKNGKTTKTSWETKEATKIRYKNTVN